MDHNDQPPTRRWTPTDVPLLTWTTHHYIATADDDRGRPPELRRPPYRPVDDRTPGDYHCEDTDDHEDAQRCRRRMTLMTATHRTSKFQEFYRRNDDQQF